MLLQISIWFPLETHPSYLSSPPFPAPANLFHFPAISSLPSVFISPSSFLPFLSQGSETCRPPILCPLRSPCLSLIRLPSIHPIRSFLCPLMRFFTHLHHSFLHHPSAFSYSLPLPPCNDPGSGVLHPGSVFSLITCLVNSFMEHALMQTGRIPAFF